MDLLQTLVAPAVTILSLPLSPGDIIGFVTGIVCVWLAARANIWNFPVGILNCIILGFLFYERRLFADAGLQLVFIVLAVRGWRQWRNGRLVHENSPVFHTSLRQLLILAGVAVLMTLLLWRLLIWANGSAPLIDALITSLSLCAQWLLNRRALACWGWWITVDLISIPLYWSRGLPLIALLYCVFLCICVSGALRWSKSTSKRVIA